ncbi:Methyltransferase domain [Geoglobus ahangari]|uniref:Methyltransferase domain n=1 Tax=Geoglobus ahangari TaxID=113653 RepID=A0A0F7ID58_9EURY|nr:class I SAM-dependent methyltransferase [Geoglobus ahangari]AKG91245.1 Methyltransferase domain [Geoglobus ahangari]
MESTKIDPLNLEILKKHTDKIKKEYEIHALKYDPNSPEASHWKGKDKVWLRFKILTEIDNLNGGKILDFGCGNALLMDYLLENNVICEYHGWDISKKMIEIGKNRHPNANFKVVDILNENLEHYKDFFDYVLVSGVFHIKVDSDPNVHNAWIKEILLRLWSLCKKGIAVNFLTEYVDWEDDDLYYCSISDIVSFCVSNLSRWFVIRHDYPLWEFTLYIYKTPRVKL